MTPDPTAPALRTSRQPPEQVFALLGPEALAERLRHIQSITDAALAHLTLDDLLRELLSRLRGILAADVVRVLLCTEEGDALAVRASLGLEGVVTEKITIPMGQGLAGRIALRREAVIVDDLSRIEVVDPAIRRLRSAMVAPLLVEGQLLGVVKVGTLEPRIFSEADLSLLQMAADRIALAIDRARRYEEARAANTKQQEAQAALSEREEHFGHFVQSVQDYAIFMLDPEGHILTWNAGAERIKGYSAEEAIGQHFSLFYTEEDRQRNHPAAELEWARRDGTYEEEGWRVRKDGSLFWANVVITALHSPEGRLVGFAKVTRDLTERRRAEETLRESEARLTRIVASTMDGIITTDEERRIVVFNQAAERLFGIPAAEAIGTSLDRFIPERYRTVHAEHMRRFGETGVTTRSMHRAPGALPALRADGTEFPVEATISQAIVGGQRLFTVVLRDVTERLQIEQARESALAAAEAARKAAEEANRIKSDFVATMSHELRTPLNAMLGYTELLLLGVPEPLPAQSRGYVERLRLSARHLLQLIEEILTFARIEAGREKVNLQAVNLEEVLEEVTAVIEPLATNKGLTFHTRTENLPARLETDPGKLRQILLNLLGNAVKFTENGQVELRVAMEDAQITFQILDTGIGITGEQRARLFEAFWQANGSFQRIAEGAGLGLAIAERFVRMLGGSIEVESTPGQGSTFTVRLPLEPAHPTHSPVEEIASRGANLPNTTDVEPTSGGG